MGNVKPEVTVHAHRHATGVPIRNMLYTLPVYTAWPISILHEKCSQNFSLKTKNIDYEWMKGSTSRPSAASVKMLKFLTSVPDTAFCISEKKRSKLLKSKRWNISSSHYILIASLILGESITMRTVYWEGACSV